MKWNERLFPNCFIFICLVIDSLTKTKRK